MDLVIICARNVNKHAGGINLPEFFSGFYILEPSLPPLLIKHMMSHKKDTVFRCPICIYECNSQRVLEQHLSEQKEQNDHGPGYYTCKLSQ